MPESEKQLPDALSKTQRKKDMHDLQNLGKSLIDLSESQLAKMDLPEDLLELIHVARKLKTHESIRRHLQYIGKRMRHLDCEHIQKSVEKIQWGNAQKTDEFHKVEEWRDQLIAEGDDGLQKLMALYPEIDRQHLRQLIRKAQHDVAKEKKTGGELELFRYLREFIHN